MPEHTAIQSLRQGAAKSAREIAKVFPGNRPALSLYIHIPFCSHKCHYCDFYSLVDTRDRREAFTARLCRELRALAPMAVGAPLQTIFVGGGTPTLLTPGQWRTILATLHDVYDCSAMTGEARSPGEFTVECNPETAGMELFDVLRAGGVNRLSFGAQSFDRGHLAMLERRHDPDSVPRAMDLARRAGIMRLSLDLIHSIPGQTLESWREDLDRVTSLRPEHVSCYNLTYEPNTAMTARLKRGEFEPAAEDLEIDMMQHAWSTLAAHGYARYEVSNFARPGEACRHNMVYWRGGQWLAAGPSASGHLAGHRWKNAPRLDDYLRFDDDGFAPMVDHEPVDARRALRENVWLGLRLAEGVDGEDIVSRVASLDGEDHTQDTRPSGPSRSARLRSVIAGLEARGLLRVESGRWILTDDGILLADGIASDLMAVIG